MQYQTLIVDGPYLAHRSYDAPYQLTTKSGLDATMIHSFIRSLNALRKQFNPGKILIAWESHGTLSWRRQLYPQYKPSRGLDRAYVSELKDLQILLYLFGAKQYYAPNNEADDVLARLSISMNDLEVKYPIIIFTVDKDLMQLVGEQCAVYDGKVFHDINKVKEKFFVYPEQIPDLLAIAGDKSDSITGLDGYGFKKAAKLLKKYGTIEKISNAKDINKQGINLLLNKQLTKLNFDCSIVEIQPKTTQTIESILDKYELEKMKDKISEYKQLGGKPSIEDYF